MADVDTFNTERAERHRERAQLLIVIGIVLAIALVSLALFLNSIIYAQNMGSRGTDIGGGDADAYLTSAETGGEGLIRAANHANQTYEEQTMALIRDVREWNTHSRLHAASSGGYTTMNTDTFQPGTQIVQDETEPLSNENDPLDSGNWTVATDVNARDFVFEFSPENVTADEDDPFQLCVSDHDITNESNLADFISHCEDETGTESLFLYNDSVTDELVVTDDPTTTSDLQCETTMGDDPIVLDIAAGTFDGEDCTTAPVFDGFDSYNIAYLNADRIEGQYRVVVDDPDHDPGAMVGLPENSYNDPESGDQPYAYDAIWSAEVALTYENSRIEYHSTVELVPGEIND